MSIKIIYATTNKSEITDAMLIEAMRTVYRKWRPEAFNCSISQVLIAHDLRKAMEAARETETIERIEVDSNGIILHILPIYGGWVRLIEDVHPDITKGQIEISSENLIPLGEALIKLGKQVMGE